MNKVLKAVASNAVIAVAVGGLISSFFTGTPSNCDIPGISDAQHEYCWNKAKAEDEAFVKGATVLMLLIFGGLTWWSYLGKWEG